MKNYVCGLYPPILKHASCWVYQLKSISVALLVLVTLAIFGKGDYLLGIILLFTTIVFVAIKTSKGKTVMTYRADTSYRVIKLHPIVMAEISHKKKPAYIRILSNHGLKNNKLFELEEKPELILDYDETYKPFGFFLYQDMSEKWHIVDLNVPLKLAIYHVGIKKSFQNLEVFIRRREENVAGYTVSGLLLNKVMSINCDSYTILNTPSSYIINTEELRHKIRIAQKFSYIKEIIDEALSCEIPPLILIKKGELYHLMLFYKNKFNTPYVLELIPKNFWMTKNKGRLQLLKRSEMPDIGLIAVN